MAKKSFKGNIDNPAELFISNTNTETEEKMKENRKKVGKMVSTSNGAKAPEGYKINPLYIETKSKRLQLLIKPSTANKLKAKAEQEKRSVNDIINSILEEVLEED